MKYAVPRKHREYAAWPRVEELRDLVAANTATLSTQNFAFLDSDSRHMRTMCLDACRQASLGYAKEMNLPSPAALVAPVVATGHQSELYQAGVWIKNHLASRLAGAVGGSSLNLIVDNDVPKHLGIVMPVREGAKARQAEAVFAERFSETAFEEHSPSLGADAFFRREVSRLAAGASFEANAYDLAERITMASGTGRSMADVLTAVRLSYEQECGLSNVELPVSRLSETDAFGVFVAGILARAVDFAGAYNSALTRYRTANHIRYHVNPVPDLMIDGTRIETPFWVWRPGGRRGRLFAAETGPHSVALFDGSTEVGRIDTASVDTAIASWANIRSAKVKIRPRALATTIFMRLFVADIFIHGIGGAKYDEVTDRIITLFFGVAPPAYAVISATLAVQWPGRRADAVEVPALLRRLRDIKYNPQIFFTNQGGECEQLIQEKESLVKASASGPEGRRRKWGRIRDINAALAASLADLRAATEERLAAVRAQLETEQVLYSRDYPCFLVGAAEACAFYDEVLAPLGSTSCPGESTRP